MSRSAPGELTELLQRFEPHVQAIALATRKAVVAEVGACHESIFPIRKWISILYSTTPRRMKDNICLVVIYPDHVNLMFMRGVDLKDPKGLLEGTGKAMRHVKMLTVADAARPGVRQLLKQAKKRPGLGKAPKPGQHVVSMITGQKPPDAPLKRRAPAEPRARSKNFPRLF
jgi:hypothetical protein